MQSLIHLFRPLLPLPFLPIMVASGVISVESAYLMALGYTWLMLLRETAGSLIQKVFLVPTPVATFGYATSIGLLSPNQGTILGAGWVMFCAILSLARRIS